MTNIKTLAAAVALSVGVGFCAGYYTKARFAKADQLDAVVESQREVAVDLRDSLKQSVAVEEKITASTQAVQEVRKQVVKRVKPPTQKPAEKPDADRPEAFANLRVRDDWTLDLGTVWMLDSAREGLPFDPTRLRDGAGEASSDVGVPELIDNDLEVVQQYHELAERHNALVDYVESVIQQQAAQ
jgi:hypothetical protein